MSYPYPGYIPYPTQSEQLSQAQETLQQSAKLLEYAKQERKALQAMLTNNALWCDIGEHAFSPKDRARKQMAVTQLDPDSGSEIQDNVMACGPCASANPLITRAAPGQAALPAAEIKQAQGAQYSADYVQRLERELGINSGPAPAEPVT